jgi:hypothetical protein
VRRVFAVGLGVVVAYVIASAIAFGVLVPIHSGSLLEQALLASSLNVLSSVAFFGGGVVTGFVANITPSPTWESAALHAPGTYASLLALPFFGHSSSLLASSAGLVSIVVASAAGVLLGAKLRGRHVAA